MYATFLSTFFFLLLPLLDRVDGGGAGAGLRVDRFLPSCVTTSLRTEIHMMLYASKSK